VAWPGTGVGVERRTRLLSDSRALKRGPSLPLELPILGLPLANSSRVREAETSPNDLPVQIHSTRQRYVAKKSRVPVAVRLGCIDLQENRRAQ